MSVKQFQLVRCNARQPFQSKSLERGAATLVVTIVLFFVMTIAVAYANRDLIFEQRTSANQYRSTQAFEIAEAGLEWAVSSLNTQAFVGNDCTANTSFTPAKSFKEAILSIDADTGIPTPTGVAPVCVVTSTGLSCSCPATGTAAVTAQGGHFRVSFAAVTAPGAASVQPGVVRVTVDGCTSTGSANADPRCLVGGTGSADGYARVSALVGLLPAVRTPPAAAITAKGNVSWQGSGAALGVINGDASVNGITINSGGVTDASKARIVTIPGSPPASSIVDNDTSLSTLSDDQMFSTFFGMSKDTYQSLATVITCPNQCAATLENAAAAGAQVIWVTNDMDIGSNVSIGSPDRPVTVVVDGNIHLNGTLDITGLVYSTAITWDNTGGGSAFLRGAAVAEGNFTGNGTPDFYYDGSILKRLALTVGSFAKVPGSWRDF